MIAHKCTAYCEPDDGIHCLPNKWHAGKTAKDFEPWFDNYEVVKVREESDVTEKMTDTAWQTALEQKECFPSARYEDYVGYLIWLRDKDIG